MAPALAGFRGSLCKLAVSAIIDGVGTAGSPGLRERKKHQTRHDLRRAALHLVLANGLEHVTVDEICVRAGYAQRTFFNHFPTKEAALIIEVGEGIDSVVAALPARIEPADLAGAVLGVLLEAGEERPVELADVAAHHQLMERYPELIPQQLRAFEKAECELARQLQHRCGAESPWPQAEVAAAMVTALMRVAFQRWILAEGEHPFHEYLRTAVENAGHLVAAAVPRAAHAQR